MRRWPTAPALVLVLFLAGCGGGTEQVALPVWQPPSPTASAPLTAKEAKGRYLAIVAPYNTALDELREAMRAGKPWRTLRTLAGRVASTSAAHAEQLRATTWPAKAQAPVDALVKENEVALRHWRAAAEASSAATLTREIRAAAGHDGGTQADTVRTALGLPLYRKP
ncbi:hypothetical protein [Micromonospora auratinigra]|uniref:Lipoprotein n=1 Tax=Micromonospora auratinigra TaxID=261654 RepID=A0A1A9A8L9_9ACTN|nr:hypothetical protein [Micromonospora auratinigra]SBT52559.1 hypothetical protein GA0070611_5688 [Micromonospora auratinigra]